MDVETFHGFEICPTGSPDEPNGNAVAANHDSDIACCGRQSLAAHHFGVQGRPDLPVSVDVIEEVPVAFLIAGIPYAVMMATPTDLHDFAAGFLMTEGIVPGIADIRGIEIRPEDGGYEVDVVLAPEPLRWFLRQRRRRNLRGHTSCGLCGIEDLADVRQRVPSVCAGGTSVDARRIAGIDAIRTASKSLRDHQVLGRRTCAAHAAAWCMSSGCIVLAREDVGRHSALDKLVGACLRGGIDLTHGFCLVTSRCSLEMVQKAVMAKMQMLVALGAPTALAVRNAEAAGLTLIARGVGANEAVYVRPPSEQIA